MASIKSIAHSIKSKLTLLTLIALLPALGGAIYYAITEYHAAQQNVQESAQRLLQSAHLDYQRIWTNAYTLLNAQGSRAITASANPRQCNTLLGHFLQEIPGYLNFGVAAPNGQVLCQAVPLAAPNIANLYFFRHASQTKQIATGPYEIDPRSQKVFVYIGKPIFSRSGQLSGIFFVAVDLSQVNILSDYATLQKNAVLAIFDDHGVVYARYPYPQQFVGRTVKASLIQAIMAQHGEGVATVESLDGVQRMTAFTTLAKIPSQTVFLAAGLSTEFTNAIFQRTLLAQMAIFGLALALIIFIIRFALDHFILRNLGGLLQTANRIRNGDLSARSLFKPSKDELGQLASAINGMAEALEQRRDQVETTIHQLEQQTQVMDRFSRMGELLQASTRMDEAAQIVVQFAREMLFDDAGALYLRNPSYNLLDVHHSWGAMPQVENSFSMEDCWALRQGKPYLVDAQHPGPRCRHVSDPDTNYLCIPILAHGEVLGLLHLHSSHSLADIRAQCPTMDIMQLARNLSEQVGFSMANLQLRESLHEQATRDPLTGLYNRRYMEEALAKEEHRANRQNTSIGLLMLDIDFFKLVNDTYGHECGDLVLQQLSRLLKQHTRDWDIACRYGGEEVVLILPGTSVQAAYDRAEEIRRQVKALKINYKGQLIKTVTVSIGADDYPAHGNSWQEVLEMADQALYRAKEGGRDRVEMATFQPAESKAEIAL